MLSRHRSVKLNEGAAAPRLPDGMPEGLHHHGKASLAAWRTRVPVARLVFRVLAVLLIGASALPAETPGQAVDGAQAALQARIPVAPMGFRDPGRLYMLSRQSFATLDFIDATHLLFTFHKFMLLTRGSDAKPWDDDQMIEAVVLDLPSGRIQARAEWRMTDRGRYLWPIGGGRFLVRQRDTYSITDSSLQLQPWLRSPSRVAATEVSADGRMLIVENDIEVAGAAERRKLAAESALTDTPPPAVATGIILVDIESRATRAEFRNELPVDLPVTSTGYVTVGELKENDYEIRYAPFDGRSSVIGDVMSTCTPRETFLSSKAILIQSCGPNNQDFYLNAWTIDGKNLWSGRRDGHHVWPTYTAALNGSRFAVGVLDASLFLNLPDSLTIDNVKRQLVQVFDTDSGKLVFETTAMPILSAGQNFALSPDGKRFAILRNGAIEVYDLPE